MHWGRLAAVMVASIVAHLLVLDRVGVHRDDDAPAPPASPIVAARLIEPPVPARPPATPIAPRPRTPPRASAKPRAAPTPRPRPSEPAAPASAPTPAIAIDPGTPIIDGVAPDAEPLPAPTQTAETPPSVVEQAALPSTPAEPTDAQSANAERPRPENAAPDPDAPFLASGTAFADEIARNGAAVKLPTSARYIYNTRYSELSLSGTTTIDWQREAMAYKLRMVTRALGFDLIELTSSGRLAPYGLAPDRYVEARTRRAPQAANFDWPGAKVSFSARNRDRTLAAGTQDRLSFQFQLMWLAQALPQRIGQDARMVLPVAGRDDVASYQFRFAGRQKVDTGLGEIETIKIERIVDRSADAQVDVWLAPEFDWLPVKLRFTDRQQRVTESVLQSLESTP